MMDDHESPLSSPCTYAAGQLMRRRARGGGLAAALQLQWRKSTWSNELSDLKRLGGMFTSISSPVNTQYATDQPD